MSEQSKRLTLQGLLFAVGMFLYIVVYVIINLGIDIFHIGVSVTSIVVCMLPICCTLLLLFIYWRVDALKKKLSNKQVIHTGIICLLIAAYTLFLLGKNEYESLFHYNRWVSEPEKRVHMIDDLLDKHDLTKYNKEGIVDLLGSPTETGYFSAPNRFVYILGPERGLVSIDNEWLVIDFNEKDNVVHYEVKRD